MNPAVETIFKHRSIRKYQDKAIPQEVLERILEAGTRASNTGNMQVYSVVVSQSAEMKAKLSPLHFNQPMIKQAPVVLTVAADVARFQHWCEINGAERSYDNFLWFVCGCIDSMLFAQNIAVPWRPKPRAWGCVSWAPRCTWRGKSPRYWKCPRG